MLRTCFLALAVLPVLSPMANAQAPTGFALQPGAWKTEATTTLKLKDGSPDKNIGQTSIGACYTQAFLDSDPFFGERPDMSKVVASGKARSCRYWPVHAKRSATQAERTVKFECALTTGHRVWAVVQTQGTPIEMHTELKVFRQGGLGHVVIRTHAQRVSENCAPDLIAPAAPSADAASGALAMTQASVALGGDTYYFDGVESDEDVVHNNYYPLEESSKSDWDREFSVSHYPALASASRLLAYLNEDNPSEGLVPGTAVKVLRQSADGRQLDVEIMRTLGASKDKPRFLYQVLHAVVEDGVQGMKAYRLQVDMAGTPQDQGPAIARLRESALAELARLRLPVYPKQEPAQAK